MSLAVAVRHKLGGISLDVGFESTGGITAVFGASGCGKTSLVNVIAGLIRPDFARISVGDTVLIDTERGIDLPPHKRRIGYVFQEARLFPHLTVENNLAYGEWFTPKSERYAGRAQILDLLGIGHLLKRRPRDLSGGEKQRVAIGRALLASPRLLLMDEPLASLDGARKAEIMPYLERLRDEVQIPIVYVSHSVAEVMRLASDVAVLAQGKLVPETFLKVVQPADSGVIKEILVKEGDEVRAGQVLMRMDASLSGADRRVLEMDHQFKALQLRRIDAELQGAPLVRKSADNPAVLAQVDAQYVARRQAYLDAVDAERAALAKANHDLKSALEVEGKLKQTLRIKSIGSDNGKRCFCFIGFKLKR